MSTVAPGEVFVDKEAGDAPPLDPRVIESSNCGERSIRAAAFQYDGESSESLLQVAWPEQALIPRERGIEVVHKILREDMRISCSQGVKGLRRNGVEQSIDGIGVGRLESVVGLKT